jgi:hypothetical protein
MSRRQEVKKNADFENNLAYLYYFNRLRALAIGRYQWFNLPDEIDERYLEEKLSQQGKAIFYNDDVLKKYVALGVGGLGVRSIYGVPVDRIAISANGYTNSSLNENNSVLIFNNNLYTSDLITIQMYAKRVADVTRSIDTNILLQKCSALLQGSQEELQGLSQMFEDIQNHVPYIVTSDKVLDSKIKEINLNIPFVANEMTITKRSIWNEALTALGISNVDNTKKERLVTDEVNKDMGDVEMTRAIGLQMRQIACDKINSMFELATPISVEFRTFNESEVSM